MKIGFIKEEGNNKKEIETKKELKVIWVNEKKDEKVKKEVVKEVNIKIDEEEKELMVTSLKEVDLVQEKVTYKNTFNLRVFMEILNYYDVTMENALKLSNDKEFCDNFIVRKTENIGKLNRFYIVERKERILTKIGKLYLSTSKKIRKVKRLRIKIDNTKIIDSILNNETIKNTDTEADEFKIEFNRKKIERAINMIKGLLKELEELGFTEENCRDIITMEKMLKKIKEGYKEIF